MKTPLTLLARIALVVLTGSLATAEPVGSAFLYQGWLSDGGTPAAGRYELQFTMYDALTGGTVVAGPIWPGAVDVADGRFTVSVDFGADRFQGEARWLEIGVRPNGSPGAFIVLEPRQPVAPAPYALHALTSSGVLSGSEPLEFKVNGQRVLRLEQPGTGGPNIVAGAASNEVSPGITNATVAGGSRHLIEARSGTVGGGLDNRIQSEAWGATIAGGYHNDIKDNAYEGTISGGQGNTIGANASASTIGGGHLNTVGNDSDHATISGGYNNDIQQEVTDAAIGGGRENTIQTNAIRSTIAGGYDNTIRADASQSTIGGGYRNTIGSGATNAAILGGARNSIGSDSENTTISGGSYNVIESESSISVIAGGYSNYVQASMATLSGGQYNSIETGAYGSTIGGGSINTVQTNASGATIAGGVRNEIQGDYATIPGGQSARADKYGQMAYASGAFSHAGDAQGSTYVLRGYATSTNEHELFLNGFTERLTLPDRALWAFDILVVGRSFGLAPYAAFELRGAISRNGTNVFLFGHTQIPITRSSAALNAEAFADVENAALGIRVSGPSGMRWVANVRTAEVQFWTP